MTKQYIVLEHYAHYMNKKNIWKYLFFILITIELFSFIFLFVNSEKQQGSITIELSNKTIICGILE